MNLTSCISRPPRSVPMSTSLVILLGSPIQSFGWFFFGIGMIFVVIFAGNADLTSFIIFHGKLQTALGMVTAEEQTRASEGGDKHHSGTPIFAYHYKFNLDGKEYDGVSYRTGSGAQSGASVTVEFPEGRPELSRIQGMRRALFGLAVAFVFIFPAVGLGCALPGLWSGWRNLRLLKHGEMAQGRLVKKENTNMTVNKRQVYRLTFEFTDKQGQTRLATTCTSEPETLEDSAFERLFYNPLKPGHASFMDSLPAEPELSPHGEVAACKGGRVFNALLPPILAMICVLGGLLLKSLF
jgi:hypothetical protein